MNKNPDGVDVVGDLWEDNGHGSMAGRVYNTEGQAPTIGASHFQQVKYILDEKVLIHQATKQGYIECKVGGVVDLSFPSSTTRRGRVQENGEICPTLMAGQQDVCYIEPTYRIRKLTPLECWRLMGFTDQQFYKAQAVNSNSQLYKQAGNSIVVDVLYWIFYKLFVDKTVSNEDLDQLQGQMNIYDFI